MRVLDAAQMRAADAAAMARVGETALMRRAGEALAAAVRRLAPDAKRVVAFAGPGNNGGDAFAAFAELDAACERVVYAEASAKTSDARRDAEARAAASGVRSGPLPSNVNACREAIGNADLVLDALLGTGARSEPGDELVPAIEGMNASGARVLAVDIPTGVDATTAAVAAHTVRATATVMLGAPKRGVLLYPARDCAGALFVADIGITGADIDAAGGARFAALDDAEFLAMLPQRPAESDKRKAGAPLVVAGSAQFPGAAILCATGAARAGAGYVTVATPQGAAASLRAHLVEQVVMTFDESDVDGSIAALCDLTNHCSSVAIGPGLGLSDACGAIVRGFIEKLELPFVADASAFFHLAKHLDILRGKRCVLTPHEREFARLSGGGTIKPGTRVERLRAFVKRTGVTTLLKGGDTLIDDGTTMHINVTGTPALATAGTGDVLSGIIATLLSQGLAPVDAARAGAYWHGLAGREAARERRVGVMAGDVAQALAAALPEPPTRESACRPLCSVLQS
jgi:ADP-dependent NAD(P)H-hydrate dehydratase / NAD(P)H-hydrate epimerase